jgi:hypothetical protein
MRPFETIAHVGPDGILTVRAPADLADRDVRVHVEAAPSPNGHHPRTTEERTKALEHLAGAIDDPTFQRPPQGPLEDVEPLD